jgi:hypothetical protein
MLGFRLPSTHMYKGRASLILPHLSLWCGGYGSVREGVRQRRYLVGGMLCPDLTRLASLRSSTSLDGR